MNSLNWKTSSYTGGTGGNCVEVAATGSGVAIRDSKNRDGVMLTLSAVQWASLVKSV